MSANGMFRAAQQTATALLNDADPADVVLNTSGYGDWTQLIQNLTDLYAQGGTPAVVRGFDALARANRDVAALVAGEPLLAQPSPEVESPALPPAAQIDPALAVEASPWLDAYSAHSRRCSPRSFDDFHEAIGLWLLSTLAARRVVVQLGKPHYTPLCIALAGRSSLHAKTTAAEIGLEVLHAAGSPGCWRMTIARRKSLSRTGRSGSQMSMPRCRARNRRPSVAGWRSRASVAGGMTSSACCCIACPLRQCDERLFGSAAQVR